MPSLVLKPPSASISGGRTPVRCSICSTIGASWPASVPCVVTSTPTMTCDSVSVANCTLYAGRNPPSAIFMLRASASVVDARAGFFNESPPRSSFIACTSAQAARAAVTLATRSSAARFFAAISRRLAAAGSSSISRLSVSTCWRASSRKRSSVSRRRNDDLPALARVRTPSCATRCSLTAPACINTAMLCVSRPSSKSACCTRKSASP